MGQTSAKTATRRSQLDHWHRRHGAVFDTVGTTRRVLRYADENAPGLSVTDLSTHPRIGFKGAGARQWLGDRAMDLPARPNCAIRQPDDSLVARLSDQEHLILDNLAADALLRNDLLLDWQREQPARCYPLQRTDSHCWLVLAGEEAAGMMSSLCAVDLRPGYFDNGAIAQTSVARVSTIVIRDDAGVLRYHLLADATMACYLWDVLLQSATRFGGGVTGLEHLLKASHPEITHGPA